MIHRVGCRRSHTYNRLLLRSKQISLQLRVVEYYLVVFTAMLRGYVGGALCSVKALVGFRVSFWETIKVDDN